MRHNSEKFPESLAGRIPLIVVDEGRKLLRRTAKKAGSVARQSRRFVGESVHRTERYTRRNPWIGIGTAACTGACVGALVTFLIYRD